MRIKMFEDMTDGGDYKPRKSKEELLRKDRQNKIDEFDTYFKNLEILKTWINTLEKSGSEPDKIILSYAIILHNFIIIERYYLDLVENGRYDINKHLDIIKNNSLAYSSYWINRTLIKLYDPEHQVRNNVEKINRLKPIHDFLSDNPEIYKRVFTEEEIEMLIQSNKYNI